MQYVVKYTSKKLWVSAGLEPGTFSVTQSPRRRSNQLSSPLSIFHCYICHVIYVVANEITKSSPAKTTPYEPLYLRATWIVFTCIDAHFALSDTEPTPMRISCKPGFRERWGGGGAGCQSLAKHRSGQSTTTYILYV